MAASSGTSPLEAGPVVEGMVEKTAVSTPRPYTIRFTDILQTHPTVLGQRFVRFTRDRCVIRFDEDEQDIPESVRGMAGSAAALDTEGKSCACAIHAVFGTPSQGGKLAVPNARRLALTLLSQVPNKMISSRSVRSRYHQFIYIF